MTTTSVPRLRSRARLGLVLTGALLLSPAIATATAAASAPIPLQGFEEHATAPGISAIFEDASSQGPQAGTAPEATAELAAGIGHALAALAWPGAVAGNAGKVVGVLGAVPQSIKDALKGANDPVRAETFAPGGPPDATYPAGTAPGSATMRSHADVNNVEAWGNTQSTTLGAAGTVGPVASHSKSSLSADGTVATAAGEVSVSNIRLGSAGPVALVSIDSVKSTAQVSSDGTTSKASGTDTVSGLKVAGVPATIDQNGLHVSSTGSGLLGTVGSAVNTAIAQSGFTIVMAKPTTQKSPTKAFESSGALVIAFSQHGENFTFTIGGASAQVLATPGLPATPTPPADTGAATPAAPAASSGSSPFAPLGGSLPSTVSAPGVSSSSTPTAPTGGGGTGTPALASAVQPFKRISAPLVILGLVGVGMLAAGLKRLPDEVLEERTSGTACPLEGRPA